MRLTVKPSLAPRVQRHEQDRRHRGLRREQLAAAEQHRGAHRQHDHQPDLQRARADQRDDRGRDADPEHDARHSCSAFEPRWPYEAPRQMTAAIEANDGRPSGSNRTAAYHAAVAADRGLQDRPHPSAQAVHAVVG